MDEQSAFDIFLDYPRQLGLNFETHLDNKRFFLSSEDPFLRTKYVVFKKDNLIICAYDSYAAKAYMTNTFTGIYLPIGLPKDIEFQIFKKDWLDHLLRFHKRKT